MALVCVVHVAAGTAGSRLCCGRVVGRWCALGFGSVRMDLTSPTYLVTCPGSHLRNVTLRSFFLPLTHELYAVTLEGRKTQRTNLNTMRTNHNCSVLHKPSTSPITSSSIIHSVAAYRVHPSKKLQRGYPYIYIRQSESGLPLQATIIEREGFDLPTCTHLHAVVPAPCDPGTLGYSEGPRSRLFLLGLRCSF